MDVTREQVRLFNGEWKIETVSEPLSNPEEGSRTTTHLLRIISDKRRKELGSFVGASGGMLIGGMVLEPVDRLEKGADPLGDQRLATRLEAHRLLCPVGCDLERIEIESIRSSLDLPQIDPSEWEASEVRREYLGD